MCGGGWMLEPRMGRVGSVGRSRVFGRSFLDGWDMLAG